LIVNAKFTSGLLKPLVLLFLTPRLYTVLAIADGRKTVEQDRAEKRESVAKSRAKVSSTSAVGDTPRVPRVATPNGTTLDTSGFSPKALEQIVKVTGNDVDTEASAEARKAVASEMEPCDAAATAPPDPDPAVIAEKHAHVDLLAALQRLPPRRCRAARSGLRFACVPPDRKTSKPLRSYLPSIRVVALGGPRR
jgi:hypothetical protein